MEVSFTVAGELAEALSDYLGRFVRNGVVIESVTVFDSQELEFKPTGEVRVFGYLAYDEHIEETRQRLEEALWHLGQIVPIPQPAYKLIHDEDWMAAWKKHYHPIEIGKQWLIIPAWMDPKPEEQRIVVKIDPAMAFGTGTHPSTQLCLQAIEQYLEPDQDVMDVGCGSGILAISALKLGARFALAVDTDKVAVRATRKNADNNGIQAQLEIGQGSLQNILDGGFSIKQAPLVLANILAPVIIRLLHIGLGELVAPGGVLVLSGILETQVPPVMEAVQETGMSLIKQYQCDDWVALVVG